MPRQLNGYVTVKDAAADLGASPATLRNWDRAGKLTPGRHPGDGDRLDREEDLDQILSKAEAMGGPAGDGRAIGAAADEGPEQ